MIATKPTNKPRTKHCGIGSHRGIVLVLFALLYMSIFLTAFKRQLPHAGLVLDILPEPNADYLIRYFNPLFPLHERQRVQFICCSLAENESLQQKVASLEAHLLESS